MTLDLSKLTDSIGPVRKNLGVKEDDTSLDEHIASLSPEHYVAAWSAWFLGYRSWGLDFYYLTHKVDEAVMK